MVMVTYNSEQDLPPHGFIGVIADTHGLVRREALETLQGAHFIIHAGNIGKPEVINELEKVAPVLAVRGNNDAAPWAEEIPDIHVLSTHEGGILIIHNIQDLDLSTVSSSCSCVVAGHSHQPSIQHSLGKILLNPGSAGPRRFKLPISLARLRIFPPDLRPEIITLGE